jgi:hypothetical protein
MMVGGWWLVVAVAAGGNNFVLDTTSGAQNLRTDRIMFCQIFQNMVGTRLSHL